jgi:hypothetical protein
MFRQGLESCTVQLPAAVISYRQDLGLEQTQNQKSPHEKVFSFLIASRLNRRVTSSLPSLFRGRCESGYDRVHPEIYFSNLLFVSG